MEAERISTVVIEVRGEDGRRRTLEGECAELWLWERGYRERCRGEGVPGMAQQVGVFGLLLTSAVEHERVGCDEPDCVPCALLVAEWERQYQTLRQEGQAALMESLVELRVRVPGMAKGELA